MKLLLHLCCSTCAIAPLQSLHLQGIRVTGFWFNPNIHPFTEFVLRRDSLQALQRLWKIDVAYDEEDCLDRYLSSVAGKGEDRCAACYAFRLDRTAAAAKQMGLEGFSTSLLVSPYQKFDKIVEAGRDAAGRHGIDFVSEDFRPGFRRAAALARELGLYRQTYCGCLSSEAERFGRAKKKHQR